MGRLGLTHARLLALSLVASAAAAWPVPGAGAQNDVDRHPDPLPGFTADGQRSTPAIAGSGEPGRAGHRPGPRPELRDREPDHR